MKKMLLLLAMVVGLIVSGCGAGLIVNVKSIQDNYNKTFQQIEPVYAVKATYFPNNYNYSAMKKKLVWNASSLSYISGALFVTNDSLIFATQQKDESVSTVFRIQYSDIVDVSVDKFGKTAGVLVNTSSNGYLLEIDKGVLVDLDKTYEIYNFVLPCTQNKNRRPQIEWPETLKAEEPNVLPGKKGTDTGFGSGKGDKEEYYMAFNTMGDTTYHRIGCPYGPKPGLQSVKLSKEQVKARGLKPCPICKP